MLAFVVSALVVSFAVHDIAPLNGTCIGQHASCDDGTLSALNDVSSCCPGLSCVRINLNITRCETSGITYAATSPPAFLLAPRSLRFPGTGDPYVHDLLPQELQLRLREQLPLQRLGLLLPPGLPNRCLSRARTNTRTYEPEGRSHMSLRDDRTCYAQTRLSDIACSLQCSDECAALPECKNQSLVLP
jgi:hypothetical protein